VHHNKALELVEALQEIQRLTAVLLPLIEEGQEEAATFDAELTSLLARISPTWTVAIAGPVNSGKSTLLSSLLREFGRHPIAAISPTNETFAPMTVGYGAQASILVSYFGIEVVRRIEELLGSYEAEGDAAQVAQYREVRNRLRRIEEVLAGTEDREVVKRIPLGNLPRHQIAEELRRHIALSAGTDDVYGIYKVDLTFPGETLESLRQLRFIDLYGFGEPSPLINIKYTRFVSEEQIDALIYVFPDRAVTQDFYRLFDLPHFLDEIVKTGRFFVVLNKADAYPERTASVTQWGSVADQFRQTLRTHVPILGRYVDRLPVLVMSAAAIDGEIQHTQAADIRRESRNSLVTLRDHLSRLSSDLAGRAAEVTIYLTGLFDLLSALDVLAQRVALNLEALEKRIPAIAQVIDQIARREEDFGGGRQERLESFRAAVAMRVEELLSAVDYKPLLKEAEIRAAQGDPKRLFRAMLAAGIDCAGAAFVKHIAVAILNVARFADEELLRAFREYCLLQDAAALHELQEIGGAPQHTIQPLSVTVEHGARNFLQLANNVSLYMSAKAMFDRFVAWYLRQRCQWDAARGRPLDAIKNEVLANVKQAVETFARVYIFEDPKTTGAYVGQICVGGEKTFWRALVEHIDQLEEILGDQVRIARWKLGLYQSRRVFVSQKAGYLETRDELLARKAIAEQLIVSMI